MEKRKKGNRNYNQKNQKKVEKERKNENYYI